MAFLRWLVVVLGGALLGVGLALHGQVALARHMQGRVDQTFVVWRWLGKATFAFQGGETRMALAMKEVPEEALVASDRAAWVLVGVGGMVALTGPLLRRAARPTGRRTGQ
ncbi:MAG: hypothetical protein JNK49_19795 [Planctomycetes bacterium]|nr:hypothetical protein [Planctomycetota bacterium]